jgi:hypothetical protein
LSGRGIASRYAGIHPHQHDGYCAGRCYGEYLKVGGTVGTKQGVRHFGLVFYIRGFPQERIERRLSDSEIQTFSVMFR